MVRNIVMIHGMCCGSWVWNNYKEYFEDKGYICHTPVLRYHDIQPGDKPDPALGTTSLHDYAKDLEKYIENLDETPILMGHSMGGLLSQILGAQGLAQGLVLLTPASPGGINALKYSVIKSFWSILTKWGFWRNPFRFSFKATVYAMLHLLPKADQKFIYDRLVFESGKAAGEIGFWYLDPNRASRVDESKVTCPVLVIAGAEDRVTPAYVVRKVAEKYKPVSTYKEFNNHAHWVLSEKGWEEIGSFISEWLDKVK